MARSRVLNVNGTSDPAPVASTTVARRSYTDTGYGRTNTRTTTPGYGRA